ncbi:hypothetical protein RB200_29240 [Streptomyces sp. PmtG]
MKCDGATPEAGIRLIGAYWLDSPSFERSPCCCPPADPVRPPTATVRTTVAVLGCLAVALCLAVVLA